MPDNTNPTATEQLDLQTDKWRFEKAARERELNLKEGELQLKRQEQSSAKWRNPLVVGIFAAAVAAMGNALVSYTNAHAQRQLEAQKAEQARILEMIKTGEPDKAAENLRFLVNAGLIVDAGLKQSVTSFLATRKPGSGPSLPPVSPVPKLAAPIVDNARVYLLAGKKDKATQFPELKQDLGGAGFAVINARYIEDVGRPDQPEVRYFYDTDKEQAEKIAEVMRFKLNTKALQASGYKDAKVKPGYIEIWLGR